MRQEQWTEQELVDQYNDEYLMYGRRSTDEPDSQKNSLSYQNIEAIKYAKLHNLPIAKIDIEDFCNQGIISERHSGFKEGKFIFQQDGKVTYDIERPKFFQLMKILSEKKFKGVIFLCWDRASRNEIDSNLLKRIAKMGVDIHFVQATYDNSGSGALHQDMDAMFALHHSRMTSEKVKLTNQKLRDEGACTYRAPVGYLNLGDPHYKPLDPIRAPIIRDMFKKYAEGGWSLIDLARWANEQGLTMPATRRRRTMKEMLSDTEVEIIAITRPLTFNNIHKILRNEFYIARVLGNDGVFIPSNSHEALIDDDTFYQVQNLLRKNTVSKHYADELHFPLRGKVRCDCCGRVYTPYGKGDTIFFGARCKVGCTNSIKNISLKEFENKIGEKIYGLIYTEKELEEINQRLQGEVDVHENNRQKKVVEIEREKKKLREDLAYLHNKKLDFLQTGVYTAQSYLEQEQLLHGKLATLQAQEQVQDVSVHEAVKDTVILSEILKDVYLYYFLAKPFEKEQFIEKIFSEITFSQNGLEYKCKDGFKVLENKSFALGDPTGNRTPI